MSKSLRTLSGETLNFLGYYTDSSTQENFAVFEDIESVSDRWLYESDIVRAIACTHRQAIQVDFKNPLKALFDLSRFDESLVVPKDCAFSLRQLQGLFNGMHGGLDMSGMLDEHSTLENLGFC